jgi:preprotein translocase subunit SecG
MYQIVLFIHVFLAVALIGLVLIQHGKGADIGAAFGSGASGTVFGSQGSGGFLFKLTGGIAMAFFATSLALGYIVSTQYYGARNAVIPQEVKQQSSEIPVPVDSEQKKPN